MKEKYYILHGLALLHHAESLRQSFFIKSIPECFCGDVIGNVICLYAMSRWLQNNAKPVKSDMVSFAVLQKVFQTWVTWGPPKRFLLRSANFLKSPMYYFTVEKCLLRRQFDFKSKYFFY